MNQLEVRTDAFAWRSAVSIFLFIAFWEIAARIHVAPAILLPTFSIVATQLWHSTLDGTLAADLSLSLARALCGLVLATAGGVVLGLLMARNLDDRMASRSSRCSWISVTEDRFHSDLHLMVRD